MVDKPLNNVEYVVAVTSVFAVVLSFTMALFLTIQCPLADLRHSGKIPQTEIDASSMVEILAKLVPDTEAIAREVKRITEVLKINVLKTAMKNKNPKSFSAHFSFCGTLDPELVTFSLKCSSDEALHYGRQLKGG